MTTHSWEEKLLLGNAGERIIDDVLLLSEYDQIDDATMPQQKAGLDRWAWVENNSIALEYKTDFMADITGNIFFEFVKNTNKDAPGWACTTPAQWLYYYVPPRGEIYALRPADWKLKHNWNVIKQYKVGYVKNKTYGAKGYCVPIKDMFDKLNLIYATYKAPVYATEQALLNKVN